MSALGMNNCLWYYSLCIGLGQFDCVHVMIILKTTVRKYQGTDFLLQYLERIEKFHLKICLNQRCTILYFCRANNAFIIYKNSVYSLNIFEEASE